MVQYITYRGTGQSIRHIPSQRVASASVRLEDLSRGLSDPDRFLFQGAATIAAGQSVLIQPMATTASYPGRAYVDNASPFSNGQRLFIVDPSGRQELAKVLGKNTSGAHYFDFTIPISQQFASGSILYPADISVSFPDASGSLARYVEEATPLVARFEYSGTYGLLSHQEEIFVVRHGYSDFGEGKVVDDFHMLYPDIQGKIGNGGANMIKDWAHLAYRDVAREINKFDNHRHILLGEMGNGLILWKLCQFVALNGYAPGAMMATEFLAEAKSRYTTVLTSLRIGEAGSETADLNTATDTAQGSRERTIFNPI